MLPEAPDAAKSFKRLSDNTDVRTSELFANLTKFSRDGLKEYSGLVADGLARSARSRS